MSDYSIRISVVIPCYNRERTIERCIKSVKNQTVKVHEIIIVDDGSDDRSIEIISSYPDVRLIRQNHKGAQAARNLGITNATGNYIGFLDSDDEWCPDMVEECIKCIKRNPDSSIYADCYAKYEDNGRLTRWNLPGESGNIYRELLIDKGPMFPGLIAPKDTLIEIGGLDERVQAYQEWETSIRLSKNHPMIHIKKPLFVYYYNSDDTISKNRVKGYKGFKYIIKKHKKEIVKECGYGQLLRHYSEIIEKLVQAVKYKIALRRLK